MSTAPPHPEGGHRAQREGTAPAGAAGKRGPQQSQAPAEAASAGNS